jgi:predicted ATPase
MLACETIPIATLTYMGFVAWYVGYPDQALKHLQEAVKLAQERPYPFSLAFALGGAAWGHQCRREPEAVRASGEAQITLSTEQGFPKRRDQGTILCGWALTMLGRGEEGILQIQQGLTALQVTGAQLTHTFYVAMLAEAYGTLHQPQEGLRVLAEAFALADKYDERWWQAELHRLQGGLLLQHSPDNQAEAARQFHRAMAVARHQHAKSWELRTATSLACLWQSQGKRQEAYDLLAPVYEWFTEGFDTRDLQEAKALLDECAGHRTYLEEQSCVRIL